MNVDRVWWREITAADLVELYGARRGNSAHLVCSLRPLLNFFGAATPTTIDQVEDFTVSAGVIGDPWLRSDLDFRFDRRRGGYVIEMGPQRHPGWGPGAGWPQLPDAGSSDNAEIILRHTGGIHLYLVRSQLGTYFAGVTTGATVPEGWPSMLHELFTGSGSGVIQLQDADGVELCPLALDILEALGRRKNVLVYGPPGTGKTFAMTQVMEVLSRSAGRDTSVVAFQPEDAARPFEVAYGDAPIPGPVQFDWVTFHQEFGYEDFILGLRPTGEGVRLAPYAGRFLELAMRVDDTGVGSGLMVIDEINRGNIPRALGDFMTYLDDTYRVAPDGSKVHALPVRLGKVGQHTSGKAVTEPIWTSMGTPRSLPIPWYLPHHLYIVATMNSVDRAVAPIDSAIARRFERINAEPKPELLMSRLGVDEAHLMRADDWDARAFAVKLMVHLNEFINEEVGPDLLLGHAFFWNVESWTDLLRVWDRDIWPQLRDRFGSRPEQLADLLRADDPGAPKDYPFRRGNPGSRMIEVRPLLDLEPPDAVAAIGFLIAGR